MEIHGMIKTSLLDYPDRLAAVFFIGGCNMRCVFCHNSALVESPDKEPVIPEEEIFSFLGKRKNMLQGIVISGGEPTMAVGLQEFLYELKSRFNLPIKLDTNGTFPNVIKNLSYNRLIDYIAMDIKSDLEGYSKICGVDIDTRKVKESISIIKNSGIGYEFRTTVVKQYYSKETAQNIGMLLDGAERYYLQQFRMCEQVLGRGKVVLTPCSRKEMLEFKQILDPYISHVELRGVE